MQRMGTRTKNYKARIHLDPMHHLGTREPSAELLLYLTLLIIVP
jgi:hypothetical protein